MLVKLKNFNRYNRFVLIVNFHNRFIKTLTEIFQFHRALLQSVSRICASLISRLWFGFSLKPLFYTTPADSKNTAWFKSFQNWPKNNHIASEI